MQLVRIEHIRCSESNGTYSIVLAPDDWSKDEVRKKIRQAQDEYLEAIKKTTSKANGGPRFPGYRPEYEKFPDLKVSEVDDLYKRQKEEYDKWKEEHTYKYSFEDMLTGLGFTPLWKKDYEALFIELDWGHRHGQSLKYGTRTDSFPRVKEMAGIDDDEYEFS